MPKSIYDALIIGGGPGGSTTATFLARAGKRVLLLEKERFPRFHIGESLLPYNRLIFEEMGVWPKLQAAGFLTKLGAQFLLGNGSKALKLVFRKGRFTRESSAFQVERAKFDHLLLDHARTCGADVHEGWTARRYSRQADRIMVEAQRDDGQTESLEASFLLDASGRVNLTGNQEGLRIVHPKLKKLAVSGHFEGVALDEGSTTGDTVIVRLADKWFWLIPLTASKVSVGCVMEQEEFARSKQSPGEIFDRLCQSGAEMRGRMAKARLVNTLQTTTDFSYYNRRLAGPRLLRVGDAAGFMDPIFSAGVYLAMYSARLAAQVVLQSLAAGDDGQPLARAYEKKVFRAMRSYWHLVEHFYTTPFIELFLEPRPRFNLPDALTAVLAGELNGGWRLDWRRAVFFGLVRLQRRWPLMPRVSFAEGETVRPPSLL